jgi:glucose-6-phosphate isomerase
MMPTPLITYDSQGVLLPKHGLTSDDLSAMGPQLLAARDEVLADARLWASGNEIPRVKRPLDAGFTDLPERLLAEYHELGPNSEVGRIRATADRLAATVDHVVVLGIGGSYMGARALQEACCHPYHNGLPRNRRGGRPRITYAGNHVDNDVLQGLLDLLEPNNISELGDSSEQDDSSEQGRAETDPRNHEAIEERWAIVVISKSGGTLETAATFRLLLNPLRAACGNCDDELAQLVVPVTGTSGKLFDLAAELGCPDVFQVPDGVGGRFSILSAVGLLPAAVMGLDIVELLQGAVAMNEHFRTAPLGENCVLDYTNVCHLMDTHHGTDIRLLSTWGNRLEAVGLWYDQLLAESLGKQEQGAMPLTVVNTRDLHSRGQQHQEGKRDKLITNLIVDKPNCKPLPIGRSEQNQDELNTLASKTFPDILEAACAGTNQAYRDENRPTTNLTLPALSEHVLGQLFQMFMLATVVEGRLIDINPYGQPGVEAYKKNMNAILRG